MRHIASLAVDDINIDMFPNSRKSTKNHFWSSNKKKVQVVTNVVDVRDYLLHGNSQADFRS